MAANRHDERVVEPVVAWRCERLDVGGGENRRVCRVVVGGNGDVGRGVPVQGQHIEAATRREDLGLQIGHGPGIADQQALGMGDIFGARLGNEPAVAELGRLEARQILHERVAAGQRRLGLQNAAAGVERLKITGDVLERFYDSAHTHVCFGQIDLALQVRDRCEADVVVVSHDIVRAE